MLESIHLKNVGPAAETKLDLAPRLNILTGDNGLGKSFLLDIAWWTLTRKWPAEVNPKLTTGQMARPRNGEEASIAFSLTGKAKRQAYSSAFNRYQQAWTIPVGRPVNPGLVIYAQVDGSFSVWDPARNYWRKKSMTEGPERPHAYVFSPREVWDGLPGERGMLCNGLINDWSGWQKERGESFRLLSAVLDALSPDGEEKLTPGALTRISLDDVRDMPTLRLPYGQDVPVIHASAGMRRIIALAYFLTWCWHEHVHASKLLGQEVADQIIFLIDEIEAHLHPRWQRLIVKSLLEVVNNMALAARVQLIAATHSPLVLASIEPVFDEQQDAWFDFDLVKSEGQERHTVQIEKKDWVRQGDASSWLVSDAFDLGSARSVEAEEALNEAAEALKDETFDHKKAQALDQKLRTLLSDTDPFWIRWRFVGEKRGWIR
ncbi:AAA family ATPase [Heliobacterium gestii]|uniref:AAA family ATPase n=1 Tax=Heliomicrobium gestii TaxID=2699 RepID=A0A845LBN3_HELGE|nr:ATP-binding protein [Heliomicrobium gestii]MBM7865676.1 hypothetical protein [Heliomicrobium gestii]MZP41925.1 AAA family ATPase [Heliomicrobium gestii]